MMLSLLQAIMTATLVWNGVAEPTLCLGSTSDPASKAGCDLTFDPSPSESEA